MIEDGDGNLCARSSRRLWQETVGAGKNWINGEFSLGFETSHLLLSGVCLERSKQKVLRHCLGYLLPARMPCLLRRGDVKSCSAYVGRRKTKEFGIE